MGTRRKDSPQVTNPEQESDANLVERAKVDGEAFGLLYERYVRVIYKYIYYRTGNTAEAEDLTEKTFFQALNNLNRYETRGVPFSAWLYRIAHNLVANWHRDRSRRRLVPLDEPGTETRATIDPVSIAEISEEHEELRSVIARLPLDRQQLLFLKFVEELPNAEIANVMRRSEGAIKALLHRTVRSVRGELLRQAQKKEKHEPKTSKRGIIPTH